MAQYDLYRNDRGQLVIDCQSDQLAELNTRFVIPLLPVDEAPRGSISRLNPIFEIEGQAFMMTTQYAAAVRLSSLHRPSGSLAGEYLRITAALDILITGF